MIAQINKEQVSVIALAVNPPRNPGFRAGVIGAKFAAGVGTVYVHGLTFVRISTIWY